MSCTTCPVYILLVCIFLQSLEEGNSKCYFFPKIVFIVSLYSWCFFLYLGFIHLEENNQEVWSLCPLFFINFLFFTKWKPFKNYEYMFFISSKKLFSFSRYSSLCNFFPSFPHFPDSKGKSKWNNLWCHKLTCINLQM